MQTLTQKLKDKGWVKTTLGEVVETNKLTIGKDFEFDEILYLDTGSITEGKIESLQKYNISEAPSRAKRLVKEKDIIYSTVRPNQKHFGFIESPEQNLVVSTGFTTISSLDNKTDSKFLYYFLTQNQIINTLQQIAEHSTSTYPSIRPEHIESLELFLPPLPTQKAIADVLSSLDDKIELLREQNKILEEVGQTIFKEWFGKYSPERPEELPEGWRVGKILEIVKREPVSYKCDKKDLDETGRTPIIDQGSNGLYGYTSRAPDFIATKENPVILFTNHTCNYWFMDYPFCAIQNVLPYRGKDGYDEYFLYFMTKGSITFIEYKGHWPDFEAKNFIIPPVEIAQEFSLSAKSILQKIQDNKEQIQTLTRTRDELLPRLMSGEVDV